MTPQPAGAYPAPSHRTYAMASIDVPSIENVLDSEDISWDADDNRLASWEINGIWQWVLYTKLRKACEIAYDPANPNWSDNVKIAAA